MKKIIKKETFDKLHKVTAIGEKHDRAISRLIENLEKRNKEIEVSEETVDRLFEITGIQNIDDALNILFDLSKKK